MTTPSGRFTRGDIQAMVERVRPDWRVTSIEPADAGHLPVFHLGITGGDAPENCVLKATPDGENHGVATEAHLLALVADRTPLPVPKVYGFAAENGVAPGPYVLMADADGTQVPRRDVGTLSDDALERLARDAGRYLAALHCLDAVDAFGRVVVEAGDATVRGPPSVSTDALSATGLQGSTPGDCWPSVLGSWLSETLEHHAETEFGDLTSDARDAVEERIADLNGAFEPVVGRIDHGLHNLLLDPETGETTAVLDWAFTLAVPPAYDLACVEANFTLGPWSMHPDTPDRGTLLRDALRESYAEHGDPAVVSQLRDRYPLYELACLLRATLHLGATMADGSPEDRAAAASEYRTALRGATDRVR